MTKQQFITYWEGLDSHPIHCRWYIKTKMWKRRGRAIVIDLTYARIHRRDPRSETRRSLRYRSRQLHVYWKQGEGVVCEYHVEHLSPRIIARGWAAIYAAERFGEFDYTGKLGLEILLDG